MSLKVKDMFVECYGYDDPSAVLNPSRLRGFSERAHEVPFSHT